MVGDEQHLQVQYFKRDLLYLKRDLLSFGLDLVASQHLEIVCSTTLLNVPPYVCTDKHTSCLQVCIFWLSLSLDSSSSLCQSTHIYTHSVTHTYTFTYLHAYIYTYTYSHVTKLRNQTQATTNTHANTHKQILCFPPLRSRAHTNTKSPQ